MLAPRLVTGRVVQSIVGTTLVESLVGKTVAAAAVVAAAVVDAGHKEMWPGTIGAPVSPGAGRCVGTRLVLLADGLPALVR